MTETELSKLLYEELTVRDLRKLARKCGLRGFWRLSKVNLVDSILAAQSVRMIESHLSISVQSRDSNRSQLEKFAIVIGAVGLVIGIAGVWVGYWGVNESRDLATRSGAFDRPEPKVMVKGYILQETERNILVMGALFDTTSVIMTGIPIEIANSGELDLEEIKLTMRYHQIWQMAVEHKDLEERLQGPFIDADLERDYSRFDPFVYTRYSLDRLGAGKAIEIREPIILRNSEFHDTVVARTSDDQVVSMDYSVQYAFVIQITLSAKNFAPITYELILSTLHSSDINETVTRFAETLRDDCSSFQRELSVLDRLLRRQFLSHDIALVLFPNLVTLWNGPEGVLLEALTEDARIVQWSLAGKSMLITTPDSRYIPAVLPCSDT